MLMDNDFMVVIDSDETTATELHDIAQCKGLRCQTIAKPATAALAQELEVPSAARTVAFCLCGQIDLRLAGPTNGAKIHLLHVPEFPPARDAIGMAAGATALSYSRQEIEAAGRRVIEKIRDAEKSGQDLIGQVEGAVGPADVESRYIVEMSQPAEVIVDNARKLDVDAVVMGSRGMSDLKGLLIGSVSHKVMHTAPCRVILVH